MSLRTQYENLGDYLIAQATIDFFSERGQLIIDIRKVPNNYIDLFDFPIDTILVKNGFITNILKNRENKWIYLIKPGGFSVATNFKMNIKNLLMGSYFRLAKIISNCEIIKMPHSLNGSMSIYDVYYHNSIDKIFTRDMETYNKIKKNSSSKIFLTSDMAMFYYKKKSKFHNSEVRERDKIAISLRYDRIDKETVITNKLIENLNTKKGLLPIFISQVLFDTKLNHQESLKYNTKNVEYNINSDSLKKIVTTYSESKYVVSNRLHSLLLGLINGSIPIALIDKEKDKKIIGCLNELNIKFFYIDDFIKNNEDIIEKILIQKEPSISFKHMEIEL